MLIYMVSRVPGVPGIGGIDSPHQNLQFPHWRPSFVRPYLIGDFAKRQNFKSFLLVFVEILHPLEAVEPWGCYSDLEH